MRALFFFLFISLFGLSLSAQEKSEFEEIELKHADKLTRDANTPKGASKLIGNVRFSHKEAIMYCDSAFLFENNSLNAYGRVKIEDGDSLVLTGDSLFYNGNTQLAKVIGNVVIDNKSSILKTPFLDYNRSTGRADYYGGGEINSIKEKLHLVSQKGHYFSEAKVFHFKQDVVMTHPDYVIKTDTMHYAPDVEKTWFFGPTDIKFDNRDIYCERGWFDQIANEAVFIQRAEIISSSQILKGDTIQYDEDKKIGISKCNVIVIDTAEHLEVRGDYAFYNEIDSTTYVTDNMLMMQDMDGDTFYLAADSMFSTFDTSGNRLMKTYHRTRFYKSDMQGVCDSLVYNTSDSMIYMFREPILWSDASQMTADSVKLLMKNDVLHRMFMDQNAFIIAHDDSIYYNQIKGKRMVGHFKDSELYKVNVFENGETVYYPREDDGNLIGVNETTCARMTIRIDSNQIKKITFYEKPVSVITPSDDMPSTGKTLEGFNYNEELRPSSVEDLYRVGEVMIQKTQLAKGILDDSDAKEKQEEEQKNAATKVN